MAQKLPSLSFSSSSWPYFYSPLSPTNKISLAVDEQHKQMDLSEGQGWLATWKAAVWALGVRHVCCPTREHREYYQCVPGVGLHQPSRVAGAHPSKARKYRAVSSFPWKLSRQAHCSIPNQSIWVKESPFLTSCCKNFRMETSCRWPQSQTTFSSAGHGRGRESHPHSSLCFASYPLPKMCPDWMLLHI